MYTPEQIIPENNPISNINRSLILQDRQDSVAVGNPKITKPIQRLGAVHRTQGMSGSKRNTTEKSGTADGEGFPFADLPEAQNYSKEQLVDWLCARFKVPILKGKVIPWSTIDKLKIPKGINQALKSEYAQWWAEAIVEEWLQHVANRTWHLVEFEAWMNVIPCHWVFTIKTDEQGKPVRFKARLVAGGNWQCPGIDFGETFAPVARLLTIRLFLAVSARRGWEIHHVDIKTAFLHGAVDKDIYMVQPQGFADGKNLVCKLDKSLYGLRQAPKQWNEKLADELILIGFTKVSADPSFWIMGRPGSDTVVYITCIVDDLAIGGPSTPTTLAVIKKIFLAFAGTHDGRIHHFSGMKITWDDANKCVYITQTAHIEDTVAKFKPLVEGTWNPRKWPMLDSIKLAKAGTNY